MTDKPAFAINLASLQTRQKDIKPSELARADSIGEQHGFVDREPRRRPGRKASPRTGQVHAKVLPEVAEAIAVEARRRGVQQGVVIEEAWALYQAQRA